MKLTRVEEEIMQIIWNLGRCTVSDIRTHIEKATKASKPPHSTISTIVRILETKGFLDHKAFGRTHEYFSIITKKEYSKSSLTNLVNDYFGGSMNQLVSFMVNENDLKASELGDLLDKLDQEED